MAAYDWDGLYKSGDFRHWDYAHASQELVSTVAALALPRGTRALDLGCGGGRETVFLALSGFRAVGVDLSGPALRIAHGRAREAGVSVQWMRASVLDLPLPSASQGFANDRGCFHHVAREHRGRYAAEVARVLRKGASLLLRGADPTQEGFVAVTEEEIDRWFARPTFARGPVLPITLVSDSGTLSANLVLLRRV